MISMILIQCGEQNAEFHSTGSPHQNRLMMIMNDQTNKLTKNVVCIF